MIIFTNLLLRLIPLYLIVFLGYIAARKLNAQKETIAGLLIYILAPVIVFYGTYISEISFANFSLPIFFFTLCCVIASLFLMIGKFVFNNDGRKNILAFTAGTGNTGYFGLPIVLILFGEEAFSLAVMSLLGFILYENTFGFYLTAKANNSAKDSLIRVIRLPTIYAFCLGLIFNLANIEIGEIVIDTISNFKAAYTVLGMMIIGMGLAEVKMNSFDFKFISLAFFAKFIVWPVLIFFFIFLDKSFLYLYNDEIYRVLVLMSIVPLAANTVALAAELKVYPEKAALAVFLSTILAFFYIPFICSLYLPR